MGPLEMARAGGAALWAHKLRGLLSVLGVVVGVGAVVAIVSMIQGATAEIGGQIAGLGARTITVTLYPTRLLQAGQPAGFFAQEITDELRALPAVSDVVPVTTSSAEAQLAGGVTTSFQMVGTTVSYADLFSLQVSQGRFLHALDGSRAVLVLGAGAARDLFGTADPVGSELVATVARQTLVFSVVGVLAERGTVGQYDLDGQTYVPISLLQQVSGNRYFSSYIAQAVSEAHVDQAVAQIESVLDRKVAAMTTTSGTTARAAQVGSRGAAISVPGQALQMSAYRVQVQREVIQAFEETAQTMMLILGGIGAISLLVGGIGIMNIMLVSVTERTREIGTRLAVGARPSEIRGQFLVEALLVCLIGGALGLAAGWIAAWLGARIGGWAFVLSPLPAAVALGFSMFVGLVFGIYPAVRASRLDPVEALRYE